MSGHNEDTDQASTSVQEAGDGNSNVLCHRSDEQMLYFLVCLTSAITYAELTTLLKANVTPLNGVEGLELSIVVIPQYPPTSEEEAHRLSQELWPTAYKGGNPYGPHPALVARAAEEVEQDAGAYLGLAERAGAETALERKGEAIGAVIVDRNQGKVATVLVAAGDARWQGIEKEDRQGHGNPMAHAVMRAIGMVAMKRRALTDSLHDESLDTMTWCREKPLTPFEQDVYSGWKSAPGGYLCLDLELYVTHEPCVMCSMAINHSRFGRVVFRHLMNHTGGLALEDRANNGYGLFWRSELNWKFLCWQYVHDEDVVMRAGIGSLHA